MPFFVSIVLSFVIYCVHLVIVRNFVAQAGRKVVPDSHVILHKVLLLLKLAFTGGVAYIASEGLPQIGPSIMVIPTLVTFYCMFLANWPKAGRIYLGGGPGRDWTNDR